MLIFCCVIVSDASLTSQYYYHCFIENLIRVILRRWCTKIKHKNAVSSEHIYKNQIKLVKMQKSFMLRFLRNWYASIFNQSLGVPGISRIFETTASTMPLCQKAQLECHSPPQKYYIHERQIQILNTILNCDLNLSHNLKTRWN